ncbi:MAG TPA: type I-U CRISPR-associated helicase/endonuclease Cas3 [Kineosporiaceae bacterium]
MPESSMTPALAASDFAAFFTAVHGYQPFAWQQALTAQVLAEGRWPDLVDVPTGLGKTSMLDVAVFVAAVTVGRPGAERIGRRRCFLVVDRRIVVDEAHAHALLLQSRLAEAERTGDPGVLGRVAAGLRAYAPDAGSGPLLPVTRMRGGTTWADAWLDRPDRPGIVLGTVDQVGSRLLFRGYGVSDRRRPIDAALTGTDALLLVDEAHLSTALLSTLTAAQERDRLGLPLPGLSVVRLSATAAPAEHVFTLDVEAHRTDPRAWQRLTAGKRLATLQTSAKDCPRVLAETAVDRLTSLATGQTPGGQAPVAAVVCNTVDRARAVHALLVKLLAGRAAAIEADCELLIGRSRPIDRPELQDRILARFGTRREPSPRAAVLVATQTVEVGVNLDVDVLVTESASWDALVQRLGRLNRLGRHAERFPGSAAAEAVVVHDGQDNGPVYGAARDATWQALRRLTGDGTVTIDVAPLACRALSGTDLAGEQVTRAPAGVPVLLRPTLDAWVQTAPVPLNDPPIEPFLHGFDQGLAGVQVVWRDGLVSDDPLDDPFDEDGAQLAAGEIDAVLTQLPPRTAEMVEVPFLAVRQWLSGQAPDAVSDLEAGPAADGRTRQVREPFQALARRPGGQARRRRSEPEPQTPTSWCWVTATQVRPGDVLVVPTERGGLDAYGWAPSERSRVQDAAERATFLPRRGRAQGVLRLDRGLGDRLGLAAPARATLVELIDGLADDDEDRPESERLHHLGRGLATLLPHDPAPGWSPHLWQALHRWAASGRLRLLDPTGARTAFTPGDDQIRVWGSLLTGPVPADHGGSPDPQVAPDRDDEEVAASSVGTGRVTLAVHHAAVRERAERIAAALGVPDDVRAVLADAAGWHDLGKVEERFQIMLHGGDACEAALAPEPLAKSGLDPADRLSWRRAADRSALPRGARHEAWSVALVAEHLRSLPTPYPGDVDLLLHLVASHHGYARPLARLVTDTDPRPVEAVVDGEKVTAPSEHTVDLDHPARFARLNERYGRWGLALLETIVRCADMTVSEEGS